MPEHGEMAFPSPLGEAWHVGELPFFVQCQDVPNNSLFGLPDRMPFVLECDSDTGTLRQRRNDEVERALERAYSFGSLITGTMDDTGIGRRYAEDFLRFFLDSVGSDLRGKRILEVGCGTGYFLSLLQERGADVLGVEPGPQGQRGGEKYGVPIVRNFFPCEEVRGGFDVVVAYAVLEHMTAPEVFLKATGGFLNEGGCLLLAVPDCEPYLGQGDISCLLHEHWSYFAKKTLARELERGGYRASRIEQAGFGGSLYCRALPKGDASAPVKYDETEAKTLDAVRARFLENLARMERLFHEMGVAGNEGHTLGIYVPGRMVNTLSVAEIPKRLCLRFFDDNPLLENKYYPSFPQKIENFDDFLRCPPDSVFVASRTFGKNIEERIGSHSEKVRLIGWDEVFS